MISADLSGGIMVDKKSKWQGFKESAPVRVLGAGVGAVGSGLKAPFVTGAGLVGQAASVVRNAPGNLGGIKSREAGLAGTQGTAVQEHAAGLTFDAKLLPATTFVKDSVAKAHLSNTDKFKALLGTHAAQVTTNIDAKLATHESEFKTLQTDFDNFHKHFQDPEHCKGMFPGAVARYLEDYRDRYVDALKKEKQTCLEAVKGTPNESDMQQAIDKHYAEQEKQFVEAINKDINKTDAAAEKEFQRVALLTELENRNRDAIIKQGGAAGVLTLSTTGKGQHLSGVDPDKLGVISSITGAKFQKSGGGYEIDLPTNIFYKFGLAKNLKYDLTMVAQLMRQNGINPVTITITSDDPARAREMARIAWEAFLAQGYDIKDLTFTGPFFDKHKSESLKGEDASKVFDSPAVFQSVCKAAKEQTTAREKYIADLGAKSFDTLKGQLDKLKGSSPAAPTPGGTTVTGGGPTPGAVLSPVADADSLVKITGAGADDDIPVVERHVPRG